jgi:hypothetical protein
MKRGDPIYRLVLREDIRLGGMLAYKRAVAPVVLRAVLASLLSHASRSGRCWPSHATIAEEAELSEASVRRALQALASASLIKRTRRAHSKADATGDRTTIYQLDWTKLEALAGLDSEAIGRRSDGSPKALPRSAERRSDGTTNHSDMNQGTARAKAVRARKDCGDGPDDDPAPVSFSEAMRRLASEGYTAPSTVPALGRHLDLNA